MASPPLQFESDPALMANNSGSNYGGYSPFYQNMGYPNTYPVNSATPPSLPPMSHSNSYTSGSNNFQFPYHDGSSAPPTSGALPSSSSAPLSTPSTQASDPLDGSHHPSHSPHAQSQPHGATPPQQHPQTPGQVRAGGGGGHNVHGASPYQNSPHHTMGMNNLMHGHAIYPGDARYQQPQRNYVDPMPMMGGRNGSRSGEMWAPNGMMSDLLNTHPGGVRNPPGRQTKQGLGLNNLGMAMNGMGPMSPMGGMPMPGMPGMPMGSDRMNWGGMVGAPTSPYGHNGHPQYMQGHAQYQPNHLAHPQSMQQHLGPHGRVGAGMGPNQGLERNGGGISKKKLKRPAAVVEKDKNCPKRPRNSYIFFTLMKRDDIKKKHPEFKPTEITKMLGEEWQKLSETEKESYGTMAENDKKRYQAEMENYDATKNNPSNNNSTNGDVNSNPNGPPMGGENWV
ncbi:hypothetical protein BGZ82_008992 [Podila clonocystis]|nr:hypothetical protein BGZ82_008992 [Podila clonocystis]